MYPLAQNSTVWEYLLPDALGSVRQIVDANGNVTLAESYEPYGTVLTSTGTASSIFGYAGEQADTTGLIYLRARYMNPTLGIFLARDPWSGDQLRPGSMNGWGYASANPILYADPSGLDPLGSTIGLRIVHGPLICAPELPWYYENVLPPPPGVWYSYSLATYMDSGKIYTHNHFEEDETPMRPHPDNRIEIYDAQGTLLGMTSVLPGGVSGHDYTVYDWPVDIRPPAFTASFGAASFQEGARVTATSVKWRWWRSILGIPTPIATSGIELVNVTAQIEFGTAKVDAQQVQLQAGNSGGGLWYDGRVIGNLKVGLGPGEAPEEQWLGRYALSTP